MPNPNLQMVQRSGSSSIVRDLVLREQNALTSRNFRRRQQFRRSDIEKLVLHHELQGHQECVNCLAWNEEGSLLASGSDDTHCIVWDPFRRRKVTDVITGHEANIFGINFMPQSNSALIATCAGDARVKVWDINHRVEIYNDHSHFARTKRITTACDAPSLLWSAGEDGLVIQHDLREPPSSPQTSRQPNGNSPRRRALISMLAHTHNHECKCIAINQIHTHLLALGSGDAYVRLFDRRMLPSNCSKSSESVASQQDTLPFYRDAERFPLPSSPPGCVRYFAPGHLTPAKQHSIDNTTGSGDNGKPTTTTNGGKRKAVAVTFIAFSRNGSELLANYNPEQVYLFDLHGNVLENRQFLPPSPPIDELTTTSNNNNVDAADVAGSDIRELKEQANECFHNKRYYDAIRLYNLALEKCHPNSSSSVLWSNRSAALMKRKHDGDVYEALLNAYKAFTLNPCNDKACFKIIRNLIDLGRYHEAHCWLEYFKQQQQRNSTAVDSSSITKIEHELDEQRKNNKRSASPSSPESGGGVSLIKNIRSASASSADRSHNLSEQEIFNRTRAIDYTRRFTGHCNSNTDIKEACFLGGFSEFIAAGSDDGCFYVWNKATTNIVRVMRADSSIVNCVAVHPDANMIATSGIDNVVRLWTPDAEDDHSFIEKTLPVKAAAAKTTDNKASTKPNIGEQLSDYAEASDANAKQMRSDPFERIFFNLREGAFPIEMLIAAAAARNNNLARRRGNRVVGASESGGAAGDNNNNNGDEAGGGNDDDGEDEEDSSTSRRVLPIQCTHQ